MLSKEDLFEQMIDSDGVMFRNLAFRVTGNLHDAEDAVQTALIRAWNKFFLFSNQAKVSSWVCRIIINESYNIQRKRMREGWKISEYDSGELSEAPAKSAVEKLEAAIAGLPELYRVTIQIAVLSEHSARDAARFLNCSENTLYQRVHKAKLLLKESMKENDYEE